MYSIHSSVFNKCGFIMRPVAISEDDDGLFNANFTPRVAVTYQNHIKEIRRMVKQQGVGFWIRFITSFRSHSEQHRLMDGLAFCRAEAIFVDMLHLLTCDDSLNELTRLVTSLRAMQAAITANDYQVLFNPTLRILMTCYDKPLDGLRLYFRFVAGVVVMFRRWRQVAWKSKKDSNPVLPWEPPLHWTQMTGRDYCDWTFEGHLLCMYGPELPQLLGLPPGLPCWLPEELKGGQVLYPAFTMEEIPVVQDMNARGNRNKKKFRRRRSRPFEEGFSGYEPYPPNVTPTSGDSGVCLLEQGQDAAAPDLMYSQKVAAPGNIESSFLSETKKEHDALTAKDPASAEMNESASTEVVNGNLPSDVPQNCETFDDGNRNVPLNKCMLPHADVLVENPCSPGRNEEVGVNKRKDNEHGDVNFTSGACMRDPEEYIEESYSPNMNDCDYCIMPENFSTDWKKCSRCIEDQFGHNHCFCNRSCQSFDWKFRPPSEHIVFNRLREAGAGDSIAQNMPYYMWTDDYPTDEERPDYLYVLEPQGPGMVHSGQYLHPGGHPALEQNYAFPYDQYQRPSPMYRREGPPRVMLGPNNFRPNCQMEEIPPMGRAPAWLEGPGNFAHPPPPPAGYPIVPVMDYMGPVPDIRRRGQQNRRFRQKRPRQSVGPPATEVCFDAPTVQRPRQSVGLPATEVRFDAPTVHEQTSSDTNTLIQNEATSSSSADQKKSLPKKKTDLIETATEDVTENPANSKMSVTEETSNCSASLETEANVPANTLSQEPCFKGDALADCEMLEKPTGKIAEAVKETSKQEESPKAEIVINKFILYDKLNLKKGKVKPGKQPEEEGNEKIGKITFLNDTIRDTEKLKKVPVKSENSSVANNDFVKTTSRTNKGKLACKNNVASDVGKPEKSGMDFEANGSLPSSLGKDSKPNVEIAKNNAPCQDEEKVTERKRKWKSVWTRRRETEIHRPEEKLTTESEVPKEKEMNNHHESDIRDGVPENVPDILKQVENSELKSFWKEKYEAPKPQRKSRPKRDYRWRQGNQESTSYSDLSQNAKKDDVAPAVTPVVKLDVVPAVEPKDKDNFAQDNGVLEQSEQQQPSETCVSEIGWYEETLAEDKDREDQREIEASDTGELKNICGVKKNKNRKWKRKQRNNRKVKDEKTALKTLIKDHSNDTTVGRDNKRENSSETSEELMQTKIANNGNNLELVKDLEPLTDGVQKDESLINGYTTLEGKVEQKDRLLTENIISTSCERETVIGKAANKEVQNTYETDNKNTDCCQSILDDILLNLPENLGDPRELSIEELLTERKITKLKDHEESINNCSSMLNEVLNSLPEPNSYLPSENIEEKKSTDHDVNENFEKDPVEQQSLDTTVTSTHMHAGCKLNEQDAIVVCRKRQASLARTLKYLTAVKFSIPLPTKRHFLKFFFMNEEILKAIENLPKKCIFITEPVLYRQSGRSIGIPQPPPFVPRKKLLLRRCDNCNILEKFLEEYKECAHCKEIQTPLPRTYCSRMCQRADWKRRHRAEHKRHESEGNRTDDSN